MSKSRKNREDVNLQPKKKRRTSHVAASASSKNVLIADKKSLASYKFVGKIYVRPSAGDRDPNAHGYNLHSYQYATSSFEGVWEPLAIIYAENNADHCDIRNAIAYARENNVSVSIRSGGHQYLGFSSTSGDNIQIDMGNYNDWDYDKNENTLIMGPSLRLNDIGAKCQKLGIFFPHGECANVAAGGHLNTGGYSPYFSSSFGMFIDTLLWFEIITADGQVRKIFKPKNTEENHDANDLWYSVLGGSPGNLGVVTRFKIRVRRDSDYAESRGIYHTMPFTKECLQDFLELYEEYNDKGLPTGYAFSITGASAGKRHSHEVDEEMRLHHHKIYGEPIQDQFLNGLLPPIIAVGAVWTGVTSVAGGVPVITPPTAAEIKTRDAWFTKIKELAKKHKPTGLKYRAFYGLINAVMGVGINVLTYNTESVVKHTPISKLADITCWKFAREFDLPFRKCVITGNGKNLKERGFADWATDIAWKIENDKKNGIKLVCQWGYYGNGENTMTATGKISNPTALAHRTSCSNVSGISCFYETIKSEGGKEVPWEEPLVSSDKWVHVVNNESFDNPATGQVGKFSKDEFRYLYAPWNPDGTTKVNLDNERKYYYDDQESYDRVLATKLRLDPKHVFTPNEFSVGINDKLARMSS